MKRKLMLSTIIVIFSVSCFVFYQKSTKNVDKIDLNEKNTSNITENQPESTENVEKEEFEDENLEQDVENTEPYDTKQESSSQADKTNPVIEKSKPTTSPSSNSVQTVKPQETSTPDPSDKSEPTVQPAEKPKEEAEKTPWEKLGISEYDYYHKPAWSWADVDFVLNGTGSNSCSNMQDCRNKCTEYGDNYIKEHSGGYYCNEVNSYSGDYLGEDFDFFELND